MRCIVLIFTLQRKTAAIRSRCVTAIQQIGEAHALRAKKSPLQKRAEIHIKGGDMEETGASIGKVMLLIQF